MNHIHAIVDFFKLHKSQQLGKFVLVFVDNILIYFKMVEDHKEHLRHVFDILTSNELNVKQSKCQLFFITCWVAWACSFKEGYIS